MNIRRFFEEAHIVELDAEISMELAMSPRLAVFRADASFEIGTGHVMRCLALSARMRDEGFDAIFICRELHGDLCRMIHENGFRVHRLREPRRANGSIRPDVDADMRATRAFLRRLRSTPEWLIVDHYQLDVSWEQGLRPAVKKMMVIDDVPARKHACDILIDQNCYDEMRERYKSLVPSRCRMLLGPDFALLRPEFVAAREHARTRDGKVKRVMVFMGGSDPTKQTLKVLDAFRLLNWGELSFDILIGINNPHRSEIESMASVLPGSICHFNASNVSTLMAGADLYVGSPGIATWERCCVGLPSLIMTTHEAQVETAAYLHSRKISLYMGESLMLTAERIAASIRSAISNPEMLSEFSKRSLAMVDGHGVERSFHEMQQG